MEARRLAITALISSSVIGMSSASLAANSGYFSKAGTSAIAAFSSSNTAESVGYPFRFSLAAHSAWKRAARCSYVKSLRRS